MRAFLKIFLSAVAVFFADYLLSGVRVADFGSALLVALVLALLNALVKPVLVFLTLPATLVTFGLFMFVINAGIILIADWMLESLVVENFWWALLFSLLVSVIQAFLYKFLPNEKQKKSKLIDQYGNEIK